jgi:hypothetical protein
MNEVYVVISVLSLLAVLLVMLWGTFDHQDKH